MKLPIVWIGLAVVAVAGPAAADEYTNRHLRDIGEGRALYLRHCAACHGPAVVGVAPAANLPGPDLTLIAERDGRFDSAHVTSHIKWGSGSPWSRSPADMPAWEVGFRPRYAPSSGDAQMVRRVWLLTHYLEFAQAGPPR